MQSGDMGPPRKQGRIDEMTLRTDDARIIGCEKWLSSVNKSIDSGLLV